MFDLNTAVAVREREDGLLERPTFDLTTAKPVEQEIRAAKPGEHPYTPPANKDRATVELMFKESGQKVPIGLQAEWVLTSEPLLTVEKNILGYTAGLVGGFGIVGSAAIPFYNMAKGVANASSPNSDIGKMVFDSAYKGLAENQDIENLGGAAAKAYPASGRPACLSVYWTTWNRKTHSGNPFCPSH